MQGVGMRRRGLVLGALLAGTGVGRAAAWQPPPLRGEAGAMLQWILRQQDHAGLPFALVDKRHARLHVFDAPGRLLASTAVLLGSTPGDHTVPGVGDRAQLRAVRADERTTPAGRFTAMPGSNLTGEHVVWLDYEAAFAIHRLRPGRAWKVRQDLLASAGPGARRVSEGCVVAPVDFYVNVVEPVLGRGPAVVYVLPETRPAREVFDLT